MVILIFFSLAAGLFFARAKREFRYTCPVPPTCIQCNYDLSGSIGARSCPECGTDWYSATSRREATSRLAVDGPRAGRALIAWASLCLYTLFARPIAIALISLNYWMDGYHHIDFITVARRDLQYIPSVAATPCTFALLLALPIFAARGHSRLGIKLVLVAFVIDLALHAMPSSQ